MAAKATRTTIPGLWSNRTPFKGSNVEGRDVTLGICRSFGHLPQQYRDAWHKDAPVYAVWSYATPIAWVASDGREVKPPVRYSQTTSRHQGRIYTV